MKKVLCLLVAAVLSIGTMPVFAEEHVSREQFLTEITRIAAEYGGNVSVYGENIVVTKNGKSCLIANDTVTYMENGKLVTESIYVDAQYVKFPQSALCSVLEVEDISLKPKKTQAYYDKIESEFGFCTITDTIETDWGTIVEWCNYAYVSPYGIKSIENQVTYIRWDGESVSISQYAPDLNDISVMKYESLTISEDGKTAIVTYPELKNTGTIQVVVDLVACTATKVIIPYVEKEETTEETTEDSDIASGKCLGYAAANMNVDTDVMWEYKNGTLTISGTGAMQDFYYTWGGRIQNTVKMYDPWGKYNSKIKKVVVKKGVTSVSRWAFEGCVNLQEVVIEDNVKVNKGAFHYLKNLEKVTLGKNCYLDEKAFRGCTALQKITIPEGTTVCYGAFSNCYALSEVDFTGTNITVQNSAFVNTIFYDKCDEIYANNELLWIKNAKDIETYIVPEGTTRIGGYVFLWSNLKEINLPESLTEIGESAFKYSKLTQIELPEGLKRIEAEAFSGCRFTEIAMPAGLEYIGDKAFARSAITSVIIGKNVTVEDATWQHSGGAFNDCQNLKKVIIEDGVEKIASGMFSWCQNLESVTVPDSVKIIGSRAFERCYSLTSLPIGSGVYEIGYSAYENCDNITTADISNVQILGDGVFSGCNKLNTVILNENLSEIPHGLFESCNSLKEVNIPKNITAIKDRAFRWTQSLTGEFVIPDSVTHIGDFAFEQSGFSSIQMPDSVTELGTGFAKGMPNLTHIKLSKNITKIPPKAFEGSKNLVSVIIPDGVEEIGYEAFNYCEKLENVVIPSTVETIGKNAFGNCPLLNSN